ncbi:MAG: regulatory protein RecX [Bacteroidota bacterium]
MIITSLKRIRGDVELIFDDGSKTLLDYRIVYDNGLRKFDDISEDMLNTLRYDSEIVQIKDSAFRFLARRLHSARELSTKLIKKGFDKSLVDETVRSLSKQKYLDDNQFAKLLMEEKSVKKRFGINKIKAELMKKGIDRKIIDSMTDRQDNDLDESNAVFLAKKKLKLLTEKTNDKRKIKEKLYSYLAGKGYESDTIMKVINGLNLEGADS